MSQMWIWMMDYCKRHHYPPAQSWAWNKAANAWRTFQTQEDKSDDTPNL